MNIASIILAAGQGTRMRSDLPKVLHRLAGKPIAWHVIEAVRQVTETKPVVVIGHGAEQVRAGLGEAVDYVLQEPQLGTGHAVGQAAKLLKGKCDLVLILAGDMPLLTADTLRRLVETQMRNRGPVTLLSVWSGDARGFGRVVRGADGQVQAVVEEAQASLEQLAIQELNTSVYCFSAGWLWQCLPRIPISPKGEYYLTDLIGIAAEDRLPVQACLVDDPQEAIGINTRVHLAEAEAVLRERTNTHWMLEGVTLIDPSAVYIEPGITIGRDTIILPGTYLHGETRVGEGCILGPNAIIRDTRIGNHCEVLASVLEGALLEDEVNVGPFARLRKGAHLAKGVHMGNFGEVKNSYLGPGAKMGHFSYIGDATIGEEANIGAGTITCNFDGVRKNKTEIGAHAFIGSDTMLVAPVKLGEGAHTGAGAVVTKNIPDHSLAVGMPARVIRKLEKSD